MKRGYIIFWILFMLFFAVPFPIILYYNTIDSSNLNALSNTSPWFALSILFVSIVMWVILLAGYFKKWILKVFITKRNIDYLKNYGIRREAKILSSTKTSKTNAKVDTYELQLAFKNLADTDITQKTVVNDNKPHERRFASGHRVDLMIDPNMKRKPYFVFATMEASINKKILLLASVGWLVFCTTVVGYYMYAFQTENYGYGWRFLSLGHPLIICPAILLLYRAILGLMFKTLGGTDKAPLIKFKGIKTAAKLLSAHQTGTYINEQPMVRFELEYNDDKRQTHRASLKKVVDLLNLDLTKQEHIDIFYVKDDPKIIGFASDLNEIS
nr:hypothetical protein [Pedobacter sp. ASV2]